MIIKKTLFGGIFSQNIENQQITSAKYTVLKQIVSEYDQEIPQSQTADKPMAPREELMKCIIMEKHSNQINTL